MTMPTKTPSLVAGTVACALAIGWAMQTFAPSAVGQATASPDVVTASMLAPPKLIAQPEYIPEDEDVVSRNDSELLGPSDIVEVSEHLAPPLPSCTVEASAEPVAHASVRLTIDAPCFPATPVAIHHTGLMFSVSSDDDGHLDITVPAMKSRAVFIVSVADGYGAVVTADVPDAAHWTRVALQWQGLGAFQIHAREFGAGYGDTGHVWSGAPSNPVTGSFLTHLGDGTGLAPRMAEIYSFPSGKGLSGLVDLTVETEVTVDTCGETLTAEALERRDAGTLTSRELNLTMPNCGAIGDFLVLNNLMEDLKIAAN
ncbi:MAG: hypothetical protein CML68_09235 [Rhodobacteraceae bacterium]|nr:hypothetical protein [Paracoccaceae bacterium]